MSIRKCLPLILVPFSFFLHEQRASANACPAVSPPTISLTAPAIGKVYLENSISFAGHISTSYDIATNQILDIVLTTTDGLGHTHTSTKFTPTSSAWTLNGITGFLFNGQNTVTVTITDCAGTTSESRVVSFRPDITGTTIQVVDKDNAGVFGTNVYGNDVLLGKTGNNGILVAQPALQDGTELIARSLLDTKGSGLNYQYHIYQTSAVIVSNGNLLKPLTSLEPDPSAIKTIQVLPGNTLIGFHIKVSLEWDATDAEINDIRDHFTNASAFLYNASDGQFFFEQVDIDDDMQNWDGADYHIYANQSLRSNVPFDWDFADVQIEPGAIQMPRPPQVGVNSHFSDIRMFIHEFGHREYNLGDEYSDDDNTVQCTSQIAGAGATVPLFMPGGAASSCLMFDPISAKKFCSNRPQNPHVHGTSQGDDPCWSTIVNHFHDSHNPANWRLVTPDMSTVILGAINSGKIPLSDWNPKFVIHNHTRGLLCAPIFLTAKDEHGNLLLNEEMWTRTFYGQYLLQGNTNDKTGAGIWITGLHPDDQINSIPVTADQCTAISPFSLVTIIPHPAVYYSVRPTIIKGQVLVTVKVVDRKKPVLSIIQAGKDREVKLPLRFDPKAGVYSATINGLPPSTTGTFKLQYAGDSNYSISPSFTLTMLPPNHVSKVISSDGKTEINVPPGALPKGTSLVIGPSPYPLPEARAGQRIVNGPIDISSSSTVSLKNFITLRLFGSATNTKDSTYKKTRVQVIHYNMKLKKWVPVDYRWIPEPISVATVHARELGSYALIELDNE